MLGSSSTTRSSRIGEPPGCARRGPYDVPWALAGSSGASEPPTATLRSPCLLYTSPSPRD
eukprot:2548793-Alexandrium_andersonii.AAC.1